MNRKTEWTWEDAFNALGTINARHCEEIDTLKNENIKLKKYVKHKKSCYTNFIDSDSSTGNEYHKKCTCGLGQVLKGEKYGLLCG